MPRGGAGHGIDSQSHFQGDLLEELQDVLGTSVGAEVEKALASPCEPIQRDRHNYRSILVVHPIVYIVPNRPALRPLFFPPFCIEIVASNLLITALYVR